MAETVRRSTPSAREAAAPRLPTGPHRSALTEQVRLQEDGSEQPLGTTGHPSRPEPSDPFYTAPVARRVLGNVARGAVNTTVSTVQGAATLGAELDAPTEQQRAFEEKSGLNLSRPPSTPAEETALYRGARRLGRAVDARFPRAEQPSFWLDQVPEGLGSMAMYLGLAAATRGRAGAAPAMTAAALGGRTEAYERAKEHGLSEEQALQAADAGSIPGAVQVMPVMNALGRLDKMTGGTVGARVRQWIASGARGAIEEMVAESLGALGQNAIASLYEEDPDLLQGVAEAAKVGGTVGAIANLLLGPLGAGAGAPASATRRTEPAAARRPEAQPETADAPADSPVAAMERRAEERRERTPLRRRLASLIDPEHGQELDATRADRDEARRAAETDPLTGLGNRAALEHARENVDAAPEWEWVALDADGLKGVNDVLGHDAGDELIRRIGGVVGKHSARGFRAGGDEFVIAVPAGEGARVGQLIEEAIGREAIGETGLTAGVTFGVGGTLQEADQELLGRKDARKVKEGSYRPRVSKANQEGVHQARAENRPGSAAGVANPDPEPSYQGLTQDDVMTLPWQEIRESAEFEANREKNIEVELFGVEGARRYDQAQRRANSTAATREQLAQADRIIAEMEGSLTPEQQNRLFGIGESGLNAEELAEISRAATDYSPESAREMDEPMLRNTVGREILIGRPDTNPVSGLRLRGALEELFRRGSTTADIMEMVVERAQREGTSPGDAAELARHTMEALKGKPWIPQMQSEKGSGLTAVGAPQAKPEKPTPAIVKAYLPGTSKIVTGRMSEATSRAEAELTRFQDDLASRYASRELLQRGTEALNPKDRGRLDVLQAAFDKALDADRESAIAAHQKRERSGGTDPLALFRTEAEKQAERDPTTIRLARAVRGGGRSSSSGGRARGDVPAPAAARLGGSTTRAKPAGRPSIDYTETLAAEAKPATLGDRTLYPISPVELTRLATELLGNKAPFLKRYPSARGMFYGDPIDPRIGINPELGRDYEQFSKTLAHEVGHLVDFLSDRDLSRGNILGRIASLRQYLAHTIDSAPSDPSRALTATDRRRLRREAEKQIGEKPAKENEAERSAWQEDVSELYAELVQKEIEARGLLTREQMTEELIALSEWWRPYDRFSAPPSYIAYRESSVELYADALSVLLNNPGALQERAPTFFDSFFAYLERKPEAESAYDAVQEILGAGEESIYAARSAELSQDFARGEQIQREADERKDPHPMLSHLKQVFVDRTAPVTDAERQRVGRSEPAHSATNAVRMALQEYNHGDNVNRLMLMDLEREVHRPMLDAGITEDAAGKFLMLQRVAEGDRGGMAEQAREAIMELTGEANWPAAKEAYLLLATESESEAATENFDPDLLALAESGVLNPHGYTPDEARRTIDGLRNELGAERFASLEQLMGRFREILFQSVEEAVRVGSYSRAVYEAKILPNKETYTPFAVLDYFNGRMPAGVKGQMGTLKGIANPYTTAVLKAMTLNRLNEHQKAKQAVLGTIDVDFPGMAGPEQAVDKYRREKHPGPGRANLTYLKDGKLHYREVDSYIAKVFERSDLGAIDRFIKTASSKTYGFFHPLYVTLSLGWQARNVPRDWKRTYKNLSAAHAGKPTYRQALEGLLDVVRLNRAYFGAMRAAWRHARRQHDPFIREMLKDRALGRAFHSFEPRSEDVKFERMMQQYGIREPRDGGLKEKGRRLATMVETMGVFQETWSKAAAFKMLTERGITGQERAYIVRNYTGTPDSTNRGLASDATNTLFMYANVIMAGIRADLEVGLQPSTASGYWMRSLMIDFAPKAAMAAAALGWMGEEAEEWMRLIPGYDKEKYITIPIYPFFVDNELGERKAVYLRFPHDDVNRVAVASIWTLLMSTRPNAIWDATGVVAGEFPGFNPALGITSKWIQAASNRNPYDSFRGRDVVPATEWEAGGWPRWREMIRHTLGEFGIISQTLGVFTMASPEEGRSAPGEKLLRSIPGLSSLIKISDRGANESRFSDLDHESQQRARIRSSLSSDVRRAMAERGRLNRFGVDRLTPGEQTRRAHLNGWYRIYLREMTIMQEARESGAEAAFQASKQRLEESARELARLR